jgi:hypothetical protein
MLYDSVHKDLYADDEAGLCYKENNLVTFALLPEEYMLKHNGEAIIMSLEGKLNGSKSGKATDKS